jgi:predicted TIM-barrel fold metal-dependent hydrolase
VIDAHTHAWDASCRVVAAHDTPGAPQPLADLLGVMDRHGIEGAVLVQPSFLGTDNAYLEACLRAHPNHLRGVAVIDSACKPAEVEALHAAGVRGIRFNLLGGADLPDLSRAGWPALLRTLRGLGWHIELGAAGPRLPALLPALAATKLDLVVDHFGMPDPALGLGCAGFQALLALGGRVAVKVSAPYRLGGLDPHKLIAALIEAEVRLVWGSDFPHTRHEGQDFAALRRLADQLPDAEGEAEVLYDFG